RKPSPFIHGRRLLTNANALSVRVASSVVHHFQEGGYEPPNLTAFAEATHGFEHLIEPVTSLPEAGVDLSALGSPPSPPAA
ncbi:MAG: hypothetical protein JOZ82_01575, partial [Marmoricola sp.]|nr:hypothetical protein [Marmoricola sp.]